MAKQQKGKSQHKYFGANFPKVQQGAVINPVIERATRNIIWHYSIFRNTNPMAKPVNEVLPVSQLRVAVQCGVFHNGFEELLLDPSLVSKLAAQGFRLERILQTIAGAVDIVDSHFVPMSWCEGTKHDLTVPFKTLTDVVEFAVRKEYDEQRIADRVEWEQNQLTKKGKAKA